jgi:hypothetical protein
MSARLAAAVLFAGVALAGCTPPQGGPESLASAPT